MRPPRTIFRTSVQVSLQASFVSPLPVASPQGSWFSTTATRPAQNRIYNSVRNPTDLNTLLLLSRSSSQPLLTLWTASWGPRALTEKTLSLLNTLLTAPSQTALASPHGVGFAEIELDAPDMMDEDIAGRYMIRAAPTLLAFSRGEPQVETKIEDVGLLGDRSFLEEWIEKEAARAGQGGAGGSLLGNWFGGSGGKS